ncbi:TPA: AAC(3) family N-acetyltransferase [Vibrio mimicus]|uniref:AAC(3) family N-acetyltransferase n=1 Tax=Vibrio mimicus TaxID=674 RepID=UPI0012AD02CE|nr:AAC(3) family N-acetyltransferase [Vibrio mimicus]
MISESDFIDLIHETGLSSSIICLHSSFKSFGEVENGPKTLIDAFIKTGCTLVCPAFFYQSQTFPSKENYKSNGIDYSKINEIRSVNYTGSNEQIEPSMGIIPKLLLNHKLASRTNHPTNSFVVAGDAKEHLLFNQSELNVYSVYKNMYDHHQDAYIVLAGVDLTSCTPIHYAEELAGRCLFRRWAVSKNRIVEVEEGSCSDGFEKLRNSVRDIEKIVNISESQIRIYSFKEFIDKIVNVISNNPEVTHCNNSKCPRCNDMVKGGRRT